MLHHLPYDKVRKLVGGNAGQPVIDMVRKYYGYSGTLSDRESAWLTNTKGVTAGGSRVDRWCRYLSVKNGHAVLDKLRSLNVLP